MQPILYNYICFLARFILMNQITVKHIEQLRKCYHKDVLMKAIGHTSILADKNNEKLFEIKLMNRN